MITTTAIIMNMIINSNDKLASKLHLLFLTASSCVAVLERT